MASSSSYQRCNSNLLMLLTAILLALAALAFLLRLRGSYDRLPPPWLHHSHLLLEMEERDASSSSSSSSYSRSLTAPSSDCWSEITPSSSGSEMLMRNSLDSNPKISITTSTSDDLDQLLPWIFYHKVIGVTNFFLFVEGMAAERSTSSVLEAIPGVEVIYKTRDLEKKQLGSNILSETWFSSFLYEPCEYKLYVKQSLNMETAIVMARDAGMDWIIHLDTDELIHPAGTNEYSITQILLDVPDYVDMVIFPNYESCIEHDNITYPFTEVSLFKRNYDHLSKDVYDSFQVDASHGNREYFLGYTNGKSATRLQDDLRPNGAHQWYNYLKTPRFYREVKSEEAAILHYTYNKFSDLTSKRHQCDCKPIRPDAKRCFMLDFDREAFVVSSTATEDGMRKWFNEHVVWNDKNQTLKLLNHGVMVRITAPMVIIKSLKESGMFNTTVALTRIL